MTQEENKMSAPMLGSACLVVGQKIRFGSFEWEVAKVEPVECEYDPTYTHKVDLVIRDRSGKPVNFATGISNHCLRR